MVFVQNAIILLLILMYAQELLAPKILTVPLSLALIILVFLVIILQDHIVVDNIVRKIQNALVKHVLIINVYHVMIIVMDNIVNLILIVHQEIVKATYV